LCFQVEKIEESFDLINARPKPLAAYLINGSFIALILALLGFPREKR
jgi:hypothetical protein